ncbi:hypothetical protein LJ737_10125 [Hymenobacter sp. 15J16-1T3B]|uniref:hypothetical protein n=1 Tax=Hymenobacter sp. 15J16-1T3B TaxID=2886941 RepID=UPI001D117834|nr:hypothetical protein [Hymenobacter sp. 15J16-1T3B]MCC3157596.1 hypothetical protein [Hymenobacter sp. 15J16-1T3B]
MHTPDLSDEELDALFRQGAERYPEELNLGAWARMEQKLDDAHVQQLVNRKVARLFAAEIGIVAVLLLIWGGYREYGPTPAESAAVAAVTTVPSASAQKQSAAPKEAPQANWQPAARSSYAAARPGGPELAQATQAAQPAEPGAGSTASATLTGTAAEPARRRPARHLQLAAAVLADDEPETTSESGEPAAEASRRRPRLRQLHLQPALLAAAARAPRRSATGREASAQPAGNAAQSKAGTQATGAMPTSGEAATAGRPHHEAAAGAAPRAGESGALAALRNERNGTNQPGSEAAHVAQTAGASSSAAVGSPAADAAQGSLAASAALTDEALLPRQAQLLRLDGEELPSSLPTDSIVKRRPRPFLPSRIFITGLYAPELSTVRNAGFEKPGYSAGVQVEYVLAPRLRLNVGLLSSMKYYQARGSDYTWYRPPMYPVDRVEGACRITDVPVNLRFDAWQGVRQRAFVSAGLSSLLMRDEKYYYNYSGYGTAYSRSWQVKKGSKHLFSVVNFSAGVERQLSLRWSVQAEPYVKLPLGGVGAGKVRLSSGGVFFGLKYGL